MRVLTTINIHLLFMAALVTKLDAAESALAVSDLPLNKIHIAGLFDTHVYNWKNIFNITMSLLQEENGWHDDILGNQTQLEWAVAETQRCNESIALREYWNMREAWNGVVHGVIGDRCSGSSTTLARLATLENVAQISPSATSEGLSDRIEFPSFARLVAPGLVQAVVATLREFGWDNVAIIGSDSDYATDFETAFSQEWEQEHEGLTGKWQGRIAYRQTVVYDGDNRVSEDSVRQTLESIPSDPTKNSRVILLVAHDEDAYDILRIATEQNFQPETIWFGFDGWAGRMPEDDSWVPEIPGYLGLSPFRNRDNSYQDFLTRFNEAEALQGRPALSDLPDYTAEYLVDSIVALVRSLGRVTVPQRLNGRKVITQMADIAFPGVSGPVQFTFDGDRLNQLYSVLNLQRSDSGDLVWKILGSSKSSIGSASLTENYMCIAGIGCDIDPADVSSIDSYPVPRERTKAWVIVIIVLLVFMLLAITSKYFLTKKKKMLLKVEQEKLASQLEQQMKGVVEIKRDLSARSADEYTARVTGTSAPSVIWYWEEDSSHIDRHKSSMRLQGTLFVAYSMEICGQLEHGYQLWREGKGYPELRVDLAGKVASSATGQKVHNANTGSHYEVDYASMKQRNSETRYQRNVQRLEVDHPGDSVEVEALPVLPEDVGEEGLLPVARGQVIQVSKVHEDSEWLFGTVLYDPLLEETVKHHSEGKGSNSDIDAVLAQALHDRPTTGWFPRSVSDTADVNAMAKLLDNLGTEGASALRPPSTWNESHAGRVDVKKGSPEYINVANFFTTALYGQRDNIRVEGIERIQNLPLWQSYALKRQSLKVRDSKNPEYRVHNKNTRDIERQWLFHGTTAEVVPKIEVQGFDRNFSGRNAVAYGKGVYFARDASYSSHTAYSEPDENGIQRMFLCRVAIGDWCRGRSGQLTPDPKPHNPLELFDCTVDNIDNPSIFVVYHDAQAYPDYLVSFRRK